MTCHFGELNSTGTVIDESKILCISPPTDTPGYVDLSINYVGDVYSSKPV